MSGARSSIMPTQGIGWSRTNSGGSPSALLDSPPFLRIGKLHLVAVERGVRADPPVLVVLRHRLEPAVRFEGPIEPRAGLGKCTPLHRRRGWPGRSIIFCRRVRSKVHGRRGPSASTTPYPALGCENGGIVSATLPVCGGRAPSRGGAPGAKGTCSRRRRGSRRRIASRAALPLGTGCDDDSKRSPAVLARSFSAGF